MGAHEAEVIIDKKAEVRKTLGTMYPGRKIHIIESDGEKDIAIKALKDIAFMASRCPLYGAGSPEGSPLRIMQIAEKTLATLGVEHE